MDELDRSATDCARDWRLRLGERFAYSVASRAYAAWTEDGDEAVLKVQIPHRESDHEADALAAWAGAGAVKLLAHDPGRHALLIERCVPGTPLSELDADAALDVLAGLLPRTWIEAHSPPFRPLAEEAAWWVQGLRETWERAGRPYEVRLIDAALEILEAFPGTQGQQVLVNQDLHGANVLAARREPWLVIDPKPLIGEREFGLAPVLRSSELGHSRRELQHRLDRLTSELGLDRERARLWCFAQTIAWSIEDEAIQSHLDTARWLLEMR